VRGDCGMTESKGRSWLTQRRNLRTEFIGTARPQPTARAERGAGAGRRARRARLRAAERLAVADVLDRCGRRLQFAAATRQCREHSGYLISANLRHPDLRTGAAARAKQKQGNCTLIPPVAIRTFTSRDLEAPARSQANRPRAALRRLQNEKNPLADARATSTYPSPLFADGEANDRGSDWK